MDIVNGIVNGSSDDEAVGEHQYLDLDGIHFFACSRPVIELAFLLIGVPFTGMVEEFEGVGEVVGRAAILFVCAVEDGRGPGVFEFEMGFGFFEGELIAIAGLFDGVYSQDGDGPHLVDDHFHVPGVGGEGAGGRDVNGLCFFVDREDARHLVVIVDVTGAGGFFFVDRQFAEGGIDVGFPKIAGASAPILYCDCATEDGSLAGDGFNDGWAGGCAAVFGAEEDGFGELVFATFQDDMNAVFYGGIGEPAEFAGFAQGGAQGFTVGRYFDGGSPLEK